MSSIKAIESKKFWHGGFLTLANIRDVVLVSLLIVLTWKLLNSNISISLQSFSFTNLISVLLAFFAIAMSAAFYFKATDTSNKFYDNSYKFTKEVSEILGRIESGFGEKLQHIDEGYSGLRDKFDKIPFDVKEAKEEEKKEEKHIQEQTSERAKIILDLMEKAKVAGGEKDALLKELEKYSNELEKSKFELRNLKKEINRVESDTDDVPPGFIKYFASKIPRRFTEKYTDVPSRFLAKHFKEMLSENLFDKDDLKFMEEMGITDERRLTAKGARVMRRSIKVSQRTSR